MRILALDLGAGWRGGQRQTQLVAAGLASRGHDVRMIALGGAPLAREAARDGRVVLVEAPAGFEASPALLLAVFRAARAFSPEVLYAGDSRSHGAAVWSGVARRHPLVVHRRVAFPPGRDPLSRIKYGVPRRYLAVSTAVRHALCAAGVPDGKVAVLADGLPPEAFVRVAAVPAPPYRLVHVGAFDGRKGQETVVDVVARLAAEGLDVTALFLGEGSVLDSVSALATSHGVAARCAFAGTVDDVPRRLAESHVLLLPSESEGAPLALTEAMAAGCAVVAHDVGGNAEMLADGAAGRLVPDLDAARWTAAVRELLLDSELRSRLITAGRATAAERTIERAVDGIERELALVAAG